LVHDFKILLIGPDGEIAKTLLWANRNTDVFATKAPTCPSADVQGCRS
jgi:hypothetical protein